jgi:hypothetical protein
MLMNHFFDLEMNLKFIVYISLSLWCVCVLHCIRGLFIGICVLYICILISNGIGLRREGWKRDLYLSGSTSMRESGNSGESV